MELVGLAALLALPFVASFIFRARAKSRRRAKQRGETFAVPARLQGTAPPYPHRLRYGKLVASSNSLVWEPRFGGTPVALGGLRFQRAVEVPTQAVQGEVRIFARDKAGIQLEFATSGDNAPLVRDLLRDAPKQAPATPPGGGTARRRLLDVVPIWALVMLLLGFAWLAAWGYLLGAGNVVTATIVENDGEEYCRVQWNDGAPQAAWVDCFSRHQPGDPWPIHAFPEPFHGDAADVYLTNRIVPIVAGLLVLPGLAGIAWRVIERRRHAAAGPSPGSAGARAGAGAAPFPDTDEELPRLTLDEVRYSRIATVVRERAALEQWQLDDPPPARTGWRSPAARAYLMSIAFAGGLPLFFGLIVTLASAGTWSNALAFRGAETRTTTGTVTETSSPFPLLPDDVYVTYAVDNREYEAITPGRGLDEDDKVVVAYLPGDPGRARLADPRHDALGTATWRSLAAAGALVGFSLYRIVRTVFALRRVARARRQPGQPARYALTLDHEGDTVALLFPPLGDVAPVLVQPLVEPAENFVPPVGDATVHGEMRDGGVVVIEAANRVLWPLGLAEEVPEEIVMHLVNGDLLFGGDDEPDDEAWDDDPPDNRKT